MTELPLLMPTPPRWRTVRAPVIPGPVRKPDWLKVRAPGGPNYMRLKGLLRTLRLHTVCEEAHCPNIGECFEDLTATFMILGDTCTRQCAFCAVTHGRPTELDLEEPSRVAEAVRTLGLKHAVVTSVNRDELADGGAGIFAATIREIRKAAPDCMVEVLIPDLRGNCDALAAIMAERPEILNHNVETVPRLYREVRPGAQYARSLELLRRAKALAPDGLTKSGIILGFGETREELLHVMADLREVGCDILTLGQYLRPSTRHIPITRFYRPEEFAELKQEGERLGFRWVEAGPLVRSSYHARGQTQLLAAAR